MNSGSAGWESKLDLVADGVIDIYDLVFLAKRLVK
jgi:hypothetical protein